MFAKKLSLVSAVVLAFSATAVFAQGDESKLSILNEYRGDVELQFIPEGSVVEEYQQGSATLKVKKHAKKKHAEPIEYTLTRDALGGNTDYRVKASGKLRDGTVKDNTWDKKLTLGENYKIVIENSTLGPKLSITKPQTESNNQD